MKNEKILKTQKLAPLSLWRILFMISSKFLNKHYFILVFIMFLAGVSNAQGSIIFDGIVYIQDGTQNGKPIYCLNGDCAIPLGTSYSSIEWTGLRWEKKINGNGSTILGTPPVTYNNEDTPNPPCSADFPWTYDSGSGLGGGGLGGGGLGGGGLGCLLYTSDAADE